MDPQISQIAIITGLVIGGVLALAVTMLFVGAVHRSLASYAAERAKSRAKQAVADADRIEAEVRARVAREKADTEIRIAKAKEGGLLADALDGQSRTLQEKRAVEIKLETITAERDEVRAALSQAIVNKAAIIADIHEVFAEESANIAKTVRSAVKAELSGEDIGTAEFQARRTLRNTTIGSR